MGATSAREKIESKMLKLKLRRVEIKQERIERVKQLEAITGKEIIREPIPDYVDHSEDEINPEEMESEENEDEIVKTKNNKNNNKKKKEKKDNESEYEEKIKKKSNKMKKKEKDKKRKGAK